MRLATAARDVTVTRPPSGFPRLELRELWRLRGICMVLERGELRFHGPTDRAIMFYLNEVLALPESALESGAADAALRRRPTAEVA